MAGGATYADALGTTWAPNHTLLRCTLDARRDPFAHEHLYVALGRVQHRRDLRILTSPDRVSEQRCPLIRNVVWKELLLPDVPTRHNVVLNRPAGPKPPNKPARKKLR